MKLVLNEVAWRKLSEVFNGLMLGKGCADTQIAVSSKVALALQQQHLLK